MHFILAAVKTGTVRVKMDQMQKRLIIHSTTHRTFGKQQWQLLRDQLDSWQSNLNTVLGSLNTLVATGGPAPRWFKRGTAIFVLFSPMKNGVFFVGEELYLKELGGLLRQVIFWIFVYFKKYQLHNK